MIEVTCAIIINDSKILAVQRGQESSHPLEWEFPGGKIHPGETAEQCIVREISEELIIRIVVLNQLELVEYDYGSKQIRLIPFVCKIDSGEIVLTEHIAKCWIAIVEWTELNWSGADQELIQKNQKFLFSILPNEGR